MIREAKMHDRKAIYDLHAAKTNSDFDTMEFYFSQLLNIDNILVNEINSHVVASIQRNDHILRLHDNRLAVSTLFGQIYKKGNPEYLDQLLDDALDEASRTSLVTLAITDSPKVLVGKGFEPIYKHRIYHINKDDLDNRSYEGVDRQFTVGELTKIYRQFTSYFDGYYERNGEYWLDMFEKLKFMRSNLVVYRNEEGQVEGYMIYRITQQKVYVNELVYLNGKAMIRLLCYAFKYKDNIEVTVSEDENLSKAIPKIRYRKRNVMLAKINNISLFNSLYQCDIKSTAEGFNLYKKSLFINEWS